MEEHKPSDKNKFSSYAQVLLALFFLMKKRGLPSVEKLWKLARPQACMIEGWNCSVSKNDDGEVKSVGVCHQSAEELLVDFFVFYSDTSLGQSVIRPHFGSTRIRKTFNAVLRKICEQRDKIDQLRTVQRDFSAAFKIQDPFDMLDCVTKELKNESGKRLYHRFANLCKQMAVLPNK